MSAKAIKRTALAALLLGAATMPAYAHIGIGPTSSFSAGLMHPLSGLDHLTVMIAVGFWAALNGGEAIWAWPAAFIGVMLAGAGLGIAHVPVPFVEPGILTSVVALGLLVALAVDLPVSAGMAIVGIFALFHGHAHGAEAPENASGLEYMMGFAIAAATLHAMGIGVGLASGLKYRTLTRAAGAVCAAIGVSLAFGAF